MGNPSPNCIRYGWFWLPFQCVFLWVACPLPGKLARVGGHRRQPVLNPAMHKASDAGHIGPHGMRRCLSFSYRRSVLCRRPPPPPEAQKRLFFEECSMCIKHRKYRQKWPLDPPVDSHGEVVHWHPWPFCRCTTLKTKEWPLELEKIN